MNTDTGTAAADAITTLGFGSADNSHVTPESLADLAELAKHHVDTAIYFQVQVLRNRGLSWGQIGAALGVTRQAAQKRYGR